MPNPQRVIWVIHSACPSRCAYCAIETQKARPSLPRDAAVAVARDIVACGFREVILVGGEPLLYPHLGDVLDVLAGKVEIALFTGGLPRLADRTIALIARGVDRVVLSVDAGGDDANDAVRGRAGITVDIDALGRRIASELPRVGLSINTVVSRANIDRVETVWQRFGDLGLDSWSLTLAGDNFGESPRDSFASVAELRRYYLETLPRLARRLAGRCSSSCCRCPCRFLRTRQRSRAGTSKRRASPTRSTPTSRTSHRATTTRRSWRATAAPSSAWT